VKAGAWLANETIIMAVAMLVFLYVGYRRGIQREVPTLFGAGAGWFLARGVGPGTAAWVNRLVKSVRFLVLDIAGTEDSAVLWQKVRGFPDLIQTPTDLDILALAVFVGCVGLVYIVTQYRCRGAWNLTGHVLGGIGGAANGLLFSRGVVLLAGRSALPLNLPQAPLGDLALAQGNGSSVMIVVIVGLLIAFGVYSASSAHGPQ